MEEKDAERQFEIDASTMSREQLYHVAKWQAVMIAKLRVKLIEEHGFRHPVPMCSICEVIAEAAK